jgi:hypothetical protein
VTIPFASPADNQCFSGARFRAPWWWAAARDCEHLAAERGRLAVSVATMQQAIQNGGLFQTHVRVPFYATPHESLYRVQLTFLSTLPRRNSPVGVDEQALSLSIETYDTDDGVSHTSAAQDPLTLILDPSREEYLGTDRDLENYRIGWPKMAYASVPPGRTVVTGWVTHRADPAGDALRTMHLTIGSTAIQALTWLTGIVAVGYVDDGEGVW